MARKEPILNEGANKPMIVVILGAIAFAGLMVYFDPAPNPKEPTCTAGEIPVFHNGWYCVTARKP